jgi:hypothetical protein
MQKRTPQTAKVVQLSAEASAPIRRNVSHDVALHSLAQISCQERRTVALWPYQGKCRLVTYHAGNGKTSVTRFRSCWLVPILINVCRLLYRNPQSDDCNRNTSPLYDSARII